MCKNCDYVEMLQSHGLEPTPLREAVFKSIGQESKPLSAVEIIVSIRRRRSINKVTLYRILDLLVEKGLVKRLSAGDRAFRYGMGENRHHPNHPHFLCTECGVMECLDHKFLPVDIEKYRNKGRRIIKHVDVRFDGICERCAQVDTK